jgi:hypothetical protein
MPDENDGLRDFLRKNVPGGHPLPGSFQSATPRQQADPSGWPPCPACAKPHPSAVCPFCRHIRAEGAEALDCIQGKNGPCERCRSCFECGEGPFDGTACPKCRFPRGWMTVHCPYCAAAQAVPMPHWGDGCDLFTLDCARCLARFFSLCIC